MTIYMKVTNDKYELPVAIADSVGELARMLGINTCNIYISILNEQRNGSKAIYKKVVIDDE